MTPIPGSTSAADAAADLHAVVAARRELGAEYDRALVENFVDRAEAELRARVARQAPSGPVDSGGISWTPETAEVGAGGLALAVTTLAWGVLGTVLAAMAVGGQDPLIGLAAIAGWAVVGVCDLTYIFLAVCRARRRRI